MFTTAELKHTHSAHLQCRIAIPYAPASSNAKHDTLCSAFQNKGGDTFARVYDEHTALRGYQSRNAPANCLFSWLPVVVANGTCI